MRNLLLVSLFVCSTARAQQTFLVNVLNGPGTHFTQITAAVAAVPDGSILLVRPGQYEPLVVDGKSVTILADSASCSSASIRNTLPHQPVAVRGLRVGVEGSWFIDNAAGRVTVDGRSDVLAASSIIPVSIFRSAQVTVAGITAFGRPAAVISNSNVVFERCNFTGGNFVFHEGFPILPASVGVIILASNVQFVHGSLQGGNAGNGAVNGASAVRMGSGTLRVLGLSASLVASGQSSNGTLPPAIEGNGVVRIDPAVNVIGIGGNVVVLRPAMPSLVAEDAGPGGTLVARRYGPVGSAYVIALCLPALAVAIPGIADPLWIDPTWNAVEVVGFTTSLTPIVVQRSVPNVPGLVGVSLTWQSADIDGNGIIALSNPSQTLVR